MGAGAGGREGLGKREPGQTAPQSLTQSQTKDRLRSIRQEASNSCSTTKSSCNSAHGFEFLHRDQLLVDNLERIAVFSCLAFFYSSREVDMTLDDEWNKENEKKR